MRDKVGELLESRASSGGSLAATSMVSILLHAAIALPLVLTVTRPPADEAAPVRVRLQSSPVPARVQDSFVPAPVVPVIEEPPTETPAVEPEPPKPRTSQIDESLFGRSVEEPAEKKQEEPVRAVPSREQAEPVSAPVAAPPSIAVGGGSAAVASFDGAEFPFPLYVDRMLSLIARRWFRPQSPASQPATVHFVITRDGKVRGIEITSSSGNATFDRAARRAVIEASPLPPLPFEYLGTDLGVHLQFK